MKKSLMLGNEREKENQKRRDLWVEKQILSPMIFKASEV